MNVAIGVLLGLSLIMSLLLSIDYFTLLPVGWRWVPVGNSSLELRDKDGRSRGRVWSYHFRGQMQFTTNLDHRSYPSQRRAMRALLRLAVRGG